MSTEDEQDKDGEMPEDDDGLESLRQEDEQTVKDYEELVEKFRISKDDDEDDDDEDDDDEDDGDDDDYEDDDEDGESSGQDRSGSDGEEYESEEYENAQVKAHSALVDFFVMYKKVLGISGALVFLGALIILSFIGFIQYQWGDGPIEAVLDPETEQIRIQAGYMTQLAITLMFVSGMFMIPTVAWLVYWLLTKGRKTHRNLLDIYSSFIHRTYVTTFELIPHQGKTKIDRLFNHLSLVFPEVERFADKIGMSFSDWWEKKKDELFFRNYDGVFTTDTGYFILKIFKTTVKWEHIKDEIDKLNKEQKINKIIDTHRIMRVICLADEYDPFFESDDLISKMKETKRNYYKIDLILEREFGYSTIWIDR